VTRVLLLRHATTADLGRALSGRSPVPLDEHGRRQAERLASRLQGVPLRAIYTSPVARALETAEAVARPHGLPPAVSDAFAEVEFGAWSGRLLASLDEEPAWRDFNAFRSRTRPPGGESFAEVQGRVAAELLRLRASHEDDVVAAVTHADVVKAALFHFGGVAADLVHRWSIAPASVSVVDLAAWGATIVSVNDTGGPPWT
jgi:probable phosphoglycerate mutase